MAEATFITDLVSSLSKEDKDRLAASLALSKPTNAELVAALLPHAEAALTEYVLQYTGRQVPRRIGDLEQLRLLLLATTLSDGVLPSPDTVANLFQKNATEAKTLLRNTATRYRHELKQAMDAAAWTVITTTAQTTENGAWTIEVRDEALLEHITEAVRRGPGNPTGLTAPTVKQMHTFVLDPSTAEALSEELGESFAAFRKAVPAHPKKK